MSAMQITIAESPSHKRLLKLCSREHHRADVLACLERADAVIQEIADGSGDTVYDEYSIVVEEMPPDTTPESFLLEMLTDLNETVDHRGFNAMNTFSARRNEGSPVVGDIIDIDIVGPDNGSVVLAELTDSYFIFTTIETPETGNHPEHGSREFGFEYQDDGSVFFYTRGVSRPRHLGVDLAGDLPQEISWTCLVQGIGDAIEERGGTLRKESFRKVRQDIVE